MQRIHFGINPLDPKYNLVTTLVKGHALRKACFFKDTEVADQETEMLKETEWN